MDDYEAAFSPASPPPLVEDNDDVTSTLDEEAGGSSAPEPVATPSSSSSSSGGKVPIVSSTTEAGGSGSTRDPRLMNRAHSQAWRYYTCPKKCGFNSRNKDRFENHLKNCGSATTKKVEANLYAPRADGLINPSKSDKSVAAQTTLEPSKILTCPKCGYKSPKKARMDIHNCQPVTQLKGKDVDSVPEKDVADGKKKELAKQQANPTKSAPVELARLKCSLCGFLTTDRKFLINHEQMHKVKSQFVCPHCSYSATVKGHLVRHTLRDHPELQKANNGPKLPNVGPSKEQPLQAKKKELPKMKERNILKPQMKVSLKVSAPKEAPVKEGASKEKATRKGQLTNETENDSTEPFNGFQPPVLSQEPKEGRDNSQKLQDEERVSEKDLQLPTEKFPKEPKEKFRAKKSAADEKKKEISSRQIPQDSANKDAPLEVASPKKRIRVSRPSNDTEKDAAVEETPLPSPMKRGRPKGSGTKKSSPKVFKCPECEFSTHHSFSTYQIHESSHKRNGAFKCELCTYSAVRQSAVDTHVERYHQNASKVPKRVADSPKDNKQSAKPLVVIPVDQLQDLGAATDDDEELPDLSLDYFQRLEDTFKTFSEGPINIDDLQDLAEQTMENAAEQDLDASEIKFVEDIALVAGALYQTYLSIKEIAESGTVNDEKLVTMNIELEEKQHRARMNAKEIRKLSDQQDAIENKMKRLGDDKIKAEMAVNRLEFDALKLKLNANQSARARTAYRDAQDQVRRFKDRVCSLDEELVKAEEEAGLLVAELEEVEEENGRDMRALIMLKKEVEELEKAVETGQVSAESKKRMKELHETAVNQRRALCVLHDHLIKLTYVKMMELIAAEEKKWLEYLDKA